MTLDGPRWGPRSGGKPRQLVVLCHGVGADGHDLIDLGPSFYSHAVPDAVFVSPDAPFPYEAAPMGRQWFSLADRSPAMMVAGVTAAADHLMRFVSEELARLGLPGDAFALMGFSQGAMTSLFAGLRRAPAPRAILAYSGALLAPDTLAAEIRNRPSVLLAHGEADPVVPVSASREAERALVALGVPVETVYTPRLQHAIDGGALSAGALLLQRVFDGDAAQ